MDVEIKDIIGTFSANSILIGPESLWDFGTDTKLENIRWYLHAPDGSVAYFQDAEGELISDAKDIIYVESIELRVPAFPQTGNWQLKLGNKGKAFGFLTDLLLVVNFNVGESSFADNIFAPIYISWAGVILGWGELSIALPCLFFLSSPIWGFALFIAVLILWTGSFKLAMNELKTGWNKIRKKKKNGGKKNVEKTKTEKSKG